MSNRSIWRAINLCQIYACSVLIWGAVLHHLNITAGSNPILVVCLGIAVGVGLAIIEGQDESFRHRRYTFREILSLALISPFQILRLL